jgi:pimeloyl-ACP methyl ester carboxylesterase
MAGAPLTHRTVATNGIRMHVAEAGEGPPVILCHGFPELWYSWRHQLPALAGAGYRAVAPDQRGYGRTEGPEEVEAYDADHLAGDLLGLLDRMGEGRAVFVGHDWGAQVVWHLALTAPDRVRAVAALSVPFARRLPLPPTQVFRATSGDRFHYILYFQPVGPADRELARDVRRSIASILWTFSGDAPRGTARRLPAEGSGYLDGLGDPPALPPWLTEEDLEVYRAEFERTGFTGALNWYRNFDRNWERTAGLAEARVEQPALFVAGERDPVLRMIPPEAMDGWVIDLRERVVVPGAGHWIQQERPEEVNAALLRFLSSLER